MKKVSYIFLSAALILGITGCASLPHSIESGMKKPSVDKSDKSNPNAAKVSPINNPVPNGFIQMIDDFEEGNYWNAGSKGSNDDYSFETTTSDEWNTSGSKCGIWRYDSVPKNERATFSCSSLYDSNWKDAKLLLANINNPSTSAITICLEIEYGHSREIARTQEVTIGIGENTNVYFDLRRNLEDEAGNSIPEIEDASLISKISFKINGKLLHGKLLVDDIRICR